MNTFVKYVLIISGSISIGLGVAGIIVPLLPTTPFLLLGAACYIKGSTKLYERLVNSRFLGTYIRSYRSGEGIPIKTKITAITVLWLTISYSAVFIIDSLILKVIIFAIAIGVTWHISCIKTRRKDNPA